MRYSPWLLYDFKTGKLKFFVKGHPDLCKTYMSFSSFSSCTCPFDMDSETYLPFLHCTTSGLFLFKINWLFFDLNNSPFLKQSLYFWHHSFLAFFFPPLYRLLFLLFSFLMWNLFCLYSSFRCHLIFSVTLYTVYVLFFSSSSSVLTSSKYFLLLYTLFISTVITLIQMKHHLTPWLLNVSNYRQFK